MEAQAWTAIALLAAYLISFLHFMGQAMGRLEASVDRLEASVDRLETRLDARIDGHL